MPACEESNSKHSLDLATILNSYTEIDCERRYQVTLQELRMSHRKPLLSCLPRSDLRAVLLRQDPQIRPIVCETPSAIS